MFFTILKIVNKKINSVIIIENKELEIIRKKAARKRIKKIEKELKEKKEKKLKEDKRLKDLNIYKSKILSQLDKDGNGKVDDVEWNEFDKLIKKHQKTILEIDRNDIKKFVKISAYLKDKKSNVQRIFESIKDTPNKEVLEEYVGIINNEVYTYKAIKANGITMIVALIKYDYITYEEIFLTMDRINIFDSQWEINVSEKLTNIGRGLDDLMCQIEASNRRIINELSNLTYATEASFSELNNSIWKELKSIDSSIKFNNLLTSIQTYQIYKVNKNTRSLRN